MSPSEKNIINNPLYEFENNEYQKDIQFQFVLQEYLNNNELESKQKINKILFATEIGDIVLNKINVTGEDIILYISINQKWRIISGTSLTTYSLNKNNTITYTDLNIKVKQSKITNENILQNYSSSRNKIFISLNKKTITDFSDPLKITMKNLNILNYNLKSFF